MLFVTITVKGRRYPYLVNGLKGNVLPESILNMILNRIGVQRGQTYTVG